MAFRQHCTRALLPLALAALPACALIGDSREALRLDPDGDGVLWPDDCDDKDATMGLPIVWFRDGDGDGFGGQRHSSACAQPEGTSAQSGDCDDDDPNTSPLGVERCDGLDNNCDGSVDEGLLVDFFPDADGDRYGNDALPAVSACSPPAGYSASPGDCDDNDPTRNPAAAERCNGGIDDDCDGRIDDEDDNLDPDSATAYYADGDTDGFGDPRELRYACDQPEGWVPNDGDCDDSSDLAHPGIVLETCGDGLDNNCDGLNGFDSGCGLPQAMGLSAADAILLPPRTDERMGAAVAGGGDLNGDGWPDLAIGAPGSDVVITDAGLVMIASGRVRGEATAVSVASLEGHRSGDAAGSALAWLSDREGYRYGELLVGAPNNGEGGPSAGVAYVVEGPVTGRVSLADSFGRLIGEAAGDRAGSALAAVGDTDGDAIPDLLIGGPGHSEAGSANLGGAWLVLGPVSGAVDLGTDAVRLLGAAAG